ncbi:DNA/RNA helicase domain-containing protein [Streptomyces sp. NPDC002187]|uniref:DNA/RNA helicase domain-containing protein n=1 Tax=Streptomyces sp. NPDC002187 TaxID=3364637 RepID=UPI0036B7002F
MDAPGGPRVWARPWNSRLDEPAFDHLDVPARPFWATDSGGHEQVGCIYTAQGMEYAYNVVVKGTDLVRRGDRWIADPAASCDSQLRDLPPHRYLRYALNTYRVLATRGTKGTRLYSTDPDTQAFLQSRWLLRLPAPAVGTSGDRRTLWNLSAPSSRDTVRRLRTLTLCSAVLADRNTPRPWASSDGC